MKSNLELRELAWRRVWHDGWLWRYIGAAVLLSLVAGLVGKGLMWLLGFSPTDSWREYVRALALNQHDHVTIVPNLTPEFIRNATQAEAVNTLVGLVTGAIVAYGMATVQLNCLRGSAFFLRDAFGGFKRPISLIVLSFLSLLIYWAWMIPAVGIAAGGIWLALRHVHSQMGLALAFSVSLFVALCISAVPYYRYRYAFLVKADHPDWGAWACLRECRRLMRGNLLLAFGFDCSYWKPILGLTLFMAAVAAGIAAASARMGMLAVAALVLVAFPLILSAVVVLGIYVFIGQAAYYRELAEECAAGDAPSVSGGVPSP